MKLIEIDYEGEQTILKLTNQARLGQSLSPLIMREDARLVARRYAFKMMHENFFAHQSPDGSTLYQRLLEGKIKFRCSGENLAFVSPPNLQSAFEGLMNSPGHYANIVRKEFKQAGMGAVIGVVENGHRSLILVQIFTD
jgi:uncharacterized protein YkwD